MSISNRFWGKKPNRIVVELKDDKIWIGLEALGGGIELNRGQAFGVSEFLKDLASGKYDNKEVSS